MAGVEVYRRIFLGSIPSAAFSTKDLASFNDFLGQVDILVLCIPATAATTRLINQNSLKALKKDAILSGCLSTDHFALQ